jgi:hypothetical protein
MAHWCLTSSLLLPSSSWLSSRSSGLEALDLLLEVGGMGGRT